MLRLFLISTIKAKLDVSTARVVNMQLVCLPVEDRGS